MRNNGYNISWAEIERRLKNMKSHYRRKKADLDQGLVQSVEWEYYAALDKIFSLQEESQPVKVTETHTKRKSESPPVKMPKIEESTPQDL